jgi:thiamine-monophosphate kinase
MDTIGREHCLDDCAVFPFRGTNIVASTDMLHEKADFPAGMTDGQRGWMSVAVTLSDIAAMGAQPCIVMLAVGLDRGGRLSEILQGAKECCDKYGAVLAGGDLDAHTELTMVSSGIGFTDHPVWRAGSRPGDLICVTGVPGRAQAALAGYHQYDPFLFEPQPMVREGAFLAEAGVTSMMDNSDGLVISLYDMLEANPGCGYIIDTKSLPVVPGIPPDEGRNFSLYGGGDFGLICTCPPGMQLPRELDTHVIGSVIEGNTVLVDGKEANIKGYQHVWND